MNHNHNDGDNTVSADVFDHSFIAGITDHSMDMAKISDGAGYDIDIVSGIWSGRSSAESQRKFEQNDTESDRETDP